MTFKLDDNTKKPIYMQLALNIMRKIETGEIVSGFRMPAERVLSEHIGISRGTIKKAYDHLVQNGVLETLHGSGTYVSSNTPKTNLTPKDKIAHLVADLRSNGYSTHEIETMFSSCLKGCGLKAAVIECNNETIKIIEKQLSYLNLSLEHFLLEDVKAFNRGDDAFEDFEIIFTTNTHYKTLETILPKSFLSGKVTRIAVSADFDTVIRISTLGQLNRGDVGIITECSRFAEIIDHNLAKFSIHIGNSDKILVEEIIDDEILLMFLQSRKCIIIPPMYAMSIDNGINKRLLDYHKNGGKIIIFNYIIEKGSLLHLEEFISKGA